MPEITRFEDIEAWQRGRELATSTARLIAGFMRYLGTSAIAGVKYRNPANLKPQT